MTRVLWHKRTVVERRVTASERHLSMSLRVDEVTVLAVAGATETIATEPCAELELGAHVAGMRSVSPRASATRHEPFALSKALVSG
jgi:hypothetical protein